MLMSDAPFVLLIIPFCRFSEKPVHRLRMVLLWPLLFVFSADFRKEFKAALQQVPMCPHPRHLCCYAVPCVSRAGCLHMPLRSVISLSRAC